ncbi:hypothetical protein Dda3937_04616 [Dickeya dadantii 3937]|uniref:Uncharacterized protein n=1 Tax=Dickeya dadantii (strain 3937) TaxID=198628 RepID=E0SGS6_DICD3|nr:hypothetical protein Dda3937_04616 [Dickeya dadantii 3937]
MLLLSGPLSIYSTQVTIPYRHPRMNIAGCHSDHPIEYKIKILLFFFDRHFSVDSNRRSTCVTAAIWLNSSLLSRFSHHFISINYLLNHSTTANRKNFI